ncbi:MAG: hypothetical protein GY708_16765 [Actinomycetia bacterium]|nr:hypothetical protein [Actinomycetes bacterium]MCP4957862.1 hypothetical protein [Actinomycetes bacterium]
MVQKAAVFVAVLSVLAIVAPHPADARSDTAPDEIVIEGHGYGHGRGLGQYGALGYALDEGWTYDQILDQYYANTTFGDPAPDEDIKVHVTALDGVLLRVTSASPFNVAGVDFAADESARIRLQGVDLFAVDRGADCEGDQWEAVATDIDGSDGQNDHPFVEAVSLIDEQGDDMAQMLHVCHGGSRRAYRGALRVVEIGGAPFVLNRLPLEQYVRGVVPRESPSYWGTLGDGAGLEALKAQAVAARSYSLAQAAGRRASGYASDTCDTQSCQVYGGAGVNGVPLDHGPSQVTTNEAVQATAGMVRRHEDDQIALTEFASSTGGWTAGLDEGSAFPSAEDAGDDVDRNPNHTWSVTIGRSVIEEVWPSIGSLVRIDITHRNGLGSLGGRVRGIDVVGTNSTVQLRFASWGGDVFRRTFGLKSDWYHFPDFEEPDPESQGLYVAKEDGTVLAFGRAVHYGDMSEHDLNSPIVGIAATRTALGYWLVASDGGIFAYGDAEFWGSTGDIDLDEPIVGMAPTKTGDGYWLVASDGGIFAFGDAGFFGSMGGIPLNQPAVGMAPAPGGAGYWLVASDGGIFAFGAAPFHGSTGDIDLDEPIVSMIGSPSGQGYSFVAADGGVFAFGDARFLGGRAGSDNRGPVVALAPSSSGAGYWIVTDTGRSFPFGDSPDYVTSVAGEGVVAVASLL